MAETMRVHQNVQSNELIVSRGVLLSQEGTRSSDEVGPNGRDLIEELNKCVRERERDRQRGVDEEER
jgi:hypothetical protein